MTVPTATPPRALPPPAPLSPRDGWRQGHALSRATGRVVRHRTHTDAGAAAGRRERGRPSIPPGLAVTPPTHMAATEEGGRRPG